MIRPLEGDIGCPIVVHGDETRIATKCSGTFELIKALCTWCGCPLLSNLAIIEGQKVSFDVVQIRQTGHHRHSIGGGHWPLHRSWMEISPSVCLPSSSGTRGERRDAIVSGGP